MLLNMNRMAYPIRTLGPGRRIALWVQGCTLHCKGCVSTDTWDESKGSPVDATELAEAISKLVIEEDLDGLTVTGGEPLEQPAALKEFLDAFRERCREKISILVFTGVEEKDVRDYFSDIASLADAFVCGPYKEDLAVNEGLVASSNQTVYASSPLGKESLLDYIYAASRQMQAKVQGSEIVFSGIPKTNGLFSIEKGLLEKGIELEGRSWMK